jgi:hypothetical protein
MFEHNDLQRRKQVPAPEETPKGTNKSGYPVIIECPCIETLDLTWRLSTASGMMRSGISGAKQGVISKRGELTNVHMQRR